MSGPIIYSLARPSDIPTPKFPTSNASTHIFADFDFDVRPWLAAPRRSDHEDVSITSADDIASPGLKPATSLRWSFLTCFSFAFSSRNAMEEFSRAASCASSSLAGSMAASFSSMFLSTKAI